MAKIDEAELVGALAKFARPVAISELGAFDANPRTLRRALQKLADDGRVRIEGVNRGRRYTLTTNQPVSLWDADGLSERVLKEITDSGAVGRTADLLIRERARAALPADERVGFIEATRRVLEKQRRA